MHFGDSIFIFLLALVLFGPKKLPEIGKQIGKLLAEFRRASNEFKFQIQEEIRNMEDEERRKKLAEAQAQTKVAEQQVQALPTAAASAPTGPAGGPTILPPQTGVTVSASAPFATPGAMTEAAVASEMAAAPGIGDPEAEVPETGAGSENAVELRAQRNGTHAAAADTPAHEVAHHD